MESPLQTAGSASAQPLDGGLVHPCLPQYLHGVLPEHWGWLDDARAVSIDGQAKKRHSVGPTQLFGHYEQLAFGHDGHLERLSDVVDRAHREAGLAQTLQ